MINVSTPMFDVIKSDLAELDEGLAGAVASSFELVTEVGAHLVSSGGKRIRPALCLLAARGGLKFDLKKVLPMAEALELIHTASLVHDDVLDEADELRLVPGRDDELVLGESAAAAVRVVPIPEHVEHVVELRQILDLALAGRPDPVVRLAHRGEAELVGQPAREDVGEGDQRLVVEAQRILAVLLRQFVELGQVAAAERAAAELRRRADRVEPARRVLVAVFETVGQVQVNGLLQVVGLRGVGDEVRALGALHLDLRAQDDAGQADAGDRRPEQRTVLVVGGAVRS